MRVIKCIAMSKISLITILLILIFTSCKKVDTQLTYDNPDQKVVFLHHSTGRNVWYGDVKQQSLINLRPKMAMVPRLMKGYNDENNLKISMEEQYFPSGETYPWKNYPYDYYNIWVEHAGEDPYKGEPTLEILTSEYDIIIFKYCFPYSDILDDDGNPDIKSEKKSVQNYKLQYTALKEKLHEFPDTEFIVWTGAALVENATTEQSAIRAAEMAEWVIDEWNTPGDNIEIFDFREIETDGGLYLKPEYAVGDLDSHPNISISAIAAESFVNKIIEVIETNY